MGVDYFVAGPAPPPSVAATRWSAASSEVGVLPSEASDALEAKKSGWLGGLSASKTKAKARAKRPRKAKPSYADVVRMPAKSKRTRTAARKAKPSQAAKKRGRRY